MFSKWKNMILVKKFKNTLHIHSIWNISCKSMPSLYMNNKIIWLHTTQEPILLLFALSGFKTVFYTPHLAIIATATFDDRFERKYALYYMKKHGLWFYFIVDTIQSAIPRFAWFFAHFWTHWLCLKIGSCLQLLPNLYFSVECQESLPLFSISWYSSIHAFRLFLLLTTTPRFCPETPSSHFYQLDHKKEHLYFIFTFKLKKQQLVSISKLHVKLDPHGPSAKCTHSQFEWRWLTTYGLSRAKNLRFISVCC